jgi:hypothetical protein
MAVAFDAKSTSATVAASSPTTNTTHTIGSITNGVLVAFVGFFTGVTTVNSVVWDAAGTNQSMTLIGTLAVATNITVGIYGLVAPTTGNKTLTATWTGTATECFLASASYSGADQTGGSTTFANANKATGTASSAVSVTLSGGTANDMAVAIGGDDNGNWSSGSDTQLWSSVGNDAYFAQYGASSASKTITDTLSAASNWAIAAVNIKAVSAGGLTAVPHQPEASVFRRRQFETDEPLGSLPTLIKAAIGAVRLPEAEVVRKRQFETDPLPGSLPTLIKAAIGAVRINETDVHRRRHFETATDLYSLPTLVAAAAAVPSYQRVQEAEVFRKRQFETDALPGSLPPTPLGVLLRVDESPVFRRRLLPADDLMRGVPTLIPPVTVSIAGFIVEDHPVVRRHLAVADDIGYELPAMPLGVLTRVQEA